MKALEILKRIYINNPDTRFQRNNIDINFTIHDFSNVNEAIKELEALENRSCESCKHSEFDAVFQTFYSSSESIFCHQCSKNFTNKWESK